MKRILIIVAAIMLAGCAGSYKPTFDHAERVEPISVHVVPVLSKEEMDVQIVVADSSAATAQFGLIGGLVGAVIDSAINKRNAIRAERLAEVVREKTVEYDLFSAATRSAAVGDGERWKVVQAEEARTSVGYDDVANNAFDSGEAEAVVVLDFDYSLTPAANQVRVNVDQRVYLRSTPKKSDRNRKPESLRTFTYYSPQVELVQRAFDDGEKERLVALLKEDYAERIAARPDEREDLEKARDSEVEELMEAESIPLVLAIREAWTPEQLNGYLDQSIEHIAFMLRHDWEMATVPEDPATRTEDEYVTINAYGQSFVTKGKDVGRKDDNEIYRSSWGHMHSMPIVETE